MSTMNSEVYAALIDANADQTKAVEAAKSDFQYDRDIGEIKTSLADIKARLRSIPWIFGFTLAFVVALSWQVFTTE